MLRRGRPNTEATSGHCCQRAVVRSQGVGERPRSDHEVLRVVLPRGAIPTVIEHRRARPPTASVGREPERVPEVPESRWLERTERTSQEIEDLAWTAWSPQQPVVASPATKRRHLGQTGPCPSTLRAELGTPDQQKGFVWARYGLRLRSEVRRGTGLQRPRLPTPNVRIHLRYQAQRDQIARAPAAFCEPSGHSPRLDEIRIGDNTRKLAEGGIYRSGAVWGLRP